MKRKTILIAGTLVTNAIVVSNTVVAQATAAGTPGQQNAASGESVSFARAFFISQGSIFGTTIIWFLLLLSIASFAFMGYLWLTNRRINILPSGIVTRARELLAEKKYRDLLDLVTHEESYFSRVLVTSLREASHGYGAMVRAMEQASEEFTASRLRRIELLNVVGNVAPMIGLFGTVYGMILTFQGIVAAGGRPDPVDLAGGIGTALTTTFWGLVVAIPSLAAYAVIRNNIDTLTSEASVTAGEIVNQFRPAPTSGNSEPTQPPVTTGPLHGKTRIKSATPAGDPSTISKRSPLQSAVKTTKKAHHKRRPKSSQDEE